MSKKKTNPAEKTQNEEIEVSANAEQEALQQQISELTNSLKEQDEKFMRLYAEFDNYRKRSTKEKADYLTNASKVSTGLDVAAIFSLKRIGIGSLSKRNFQAKLIDRRSNLAFP